MAGMTIRNLDDSLKRRLRVHAAEQGTSMEEAAREILRSVIVLDTNVLLELMRPAPDVRVGQWMGRYPDASLFTTTITQAEILYGISILPDGKRKQSLAAAIETMFEEDGPHPHRAGGRFLSGRRHDAELCQRPPRPSPRSGRRVVTGARPAGWGPVGASVHVRAGTQLSSAARYTTGGTRFTCPPCICHVGWGLPLVQPPGLYPRGESDDLPCPRATTTPETCPSGT